MRGSDSNLMGIVSTKPAILGNAPGNEHRENNDNYKIIAMLDQIPACVSTENGEIRPGDSLTSASSTLGCAMRANAGDPTVGVALEELLNTKTHPTPSGHPSREGTINVLISRRNKSVTVETVEAQITERIANMEIEDEVQIMLSQAIDTYNLASSTEAIVDDQIAELDTILTVEFDSVNSQITNLASNLDDLIERVVITENGLERMSNNQLTIINDLDIINNQISTTTGELIARQDELEARVDVLEEIIASSTGVNLSQNNDNETNVEIITSSSTEIDAFVVNQQGNGDIADFQYDGVTVVNISREKQVTIIGELMVDGRIMVCSGGACSLALDESVDEALGDMGVEGTVVAGAFASYCEDGFIWVEGSSKYGTMPGFCVMQDEAKFADMNGDGIAEISEIINEENPSWDHLTQGGAKLACQSLGEAYHLISENEWLSIADSVIRNNDNDIDADQEGLQIATSSNPFATTTHYISNGEEIYNLAGGLGEWTDKTITKAGVFIPYNDEWQEYSSIEDYKGEGLAPPYYYNSSNGIGRVKTGIEENEDNLRAFVRGQSAIFDLDLTISPTIATSSIGFRCAR